MKSWASHSVIIWWFCLDHLHVYTYFWNILLHLVHKQPFKWPIFLAAAHIPSLVTQPLPFLLIPAAPSIHNFLFYFSFLMRYYHFWNTKPTYQFQISVEGKNKMLIKFKLTWLLKKQTYLWDYILIKTFLPFLSSLQALL